MYFICFLNQTDMAKKSALTRVENEIKNAKARLVETHGELLKIKSLITRDIESIEKILESVSDVRDKNVSLLELILFVAYEYNVDHMVLYDKQQNYQRTNGKRTFVSIAVNYLGYSIAEAMSYLKRERTTGYKLLSTHEDLMRFKVDMAYCLKYENILAKVKKLEVEKRSIEENK